MLTTVRTSFSSRGHTASEPPATRRPPRPNRPTCCCTSIDAHPRYASCATVFLSSTSPRSPLFHLSSSPRDPVTLFFRSARTRSTRPARRTAGRDIFAGRGRWTRGSGKLCWTRACTAASRGRFALRCCIPARGMETSSCSRCIEQRRLRARAPRRLSRGSRREDNVSRCRGFLRRFPASSTQFYSPGERSKRGAHAPIGPCRCPRQSCRRRERRPSDLRTFSGRCSPRCVLWSAEIQEEL